MMCAVQAISSKVLRHLMLQLLACSGPCDPSHVGTCYVAGPCCLARSLSYLHSLAECLEFRMGLEIEPNELEASALGSGPSAG